MKPTPRTDAAWKDALRLPGGGYSANPNTMGLAVEMSRFANSLELELADALALNYEKGEILDSISDALDLPTGSADEDIESAVVDAIKGLDDLREAVRLTLMENLHLADGDVCTLKRLKDAIGFELPPEKWVDPAPGHPEMPLDYETPAYCPPRYVHGVCGNDPCTCPPEDRKPRRATIKDDGHLEKLDVPVDRDVDPQLAGWMKVIRPNA